MTAYQRWARDPPESLDHSDPPPFLSLDPSLEKGIGILKVSIPVSKKGLAFESLDPSLEKGITDNQVTSGWLYALRGAPF